MYIFGIFIIHYLLIFSFKMVCRLASAGGRGLRSRLALHVFACHSHICSPRKFFWQRRCFSTCWPCSNFRHVSPPLYYQAIPGVYTLHDISAVSVSAWLTGCNLYSQYHIGLQHLQLLQLMYSFKHACTYYTRARTVDFTNNSDH